MKTRLCLCAGVLAARDAGLTFMVGGTDLGFAHAEPILKLMGKNVVHTGRCGTGQVSTPGTGQASTPGTAAPGRSVHRVLQHRAGQYTGHWAGQYTGRCSTGQVSTRVLREVSTPDMSTPDSPVSSQQPLPCNVASVLFLLLLCVRIWDLGSREHSEEIDLPM